MQGGGAAEAGGEQRVECFARRHGVTLIPEMAVAAETSAVEVSIARLAEPRPARRIGLVWRRTNPLARHFQEIGEIVREEHAILRRQDGAAHSSQSAQYA